MRRVSSPFDEDNEAVGEAEAGVVVEEIAQGLEVLFGAEGEAADDGVDGLRGAVAEQCDECVADGIQLPLREVGVGSAEADVAAATVGGVGLAEVT